MTVEELDIIVQASVEGAIKEFNKLLPTIKQQLSGIQKEFDKLNIKDITVNIDLKPVTNEMKKVEEQIKEAFNPDIAKFTINAKKEITEISKEFSKLTGKKIDLGNAVELKNYNNKLKETVNLPKQTGSSAKGRFIGYNVGKIQSFINNQNKTNNNNSNIKNPDIEPDSKKVSSMWDILKGKIAQTKKTVSEFVNATKGNSGFPKMISPLNGISGLTVKIKNQIKQWGTGIKSGLSHVLKYVGSLFSLSGIYSRLSSSASSWLSSQNEGAKQLSANIEYMKIAMGSALAPVIQFVTNLIYQLMKAIQSVVYAFSGINIFAKATSSSMNAVGGSAKKAKQETKQLAGIHNEISNISDNKNSDSNSGSGGTILPNLDLSQMDTQLSPLAQKLIDFFAPLKESWDNYGARLIEQLKVTAGQVGGLISSVWGSFENIITNGTVYTSLELILAIIGNIAEAFSTAWNYNGNGDAIVQNLANAFNNLLGAINNVVQSEGFQSWLNWCSDKFGEMSEKIASIDWQPLLNALSDIGQNLGTIALEILSALVDVFKWLVENPIVAETLIAIAVAISLIATAINIYNMAMEIYNVIMPIATAVSKEFGISISGLIAIVVAIVAVIALVVLAIMNWGTIVEWIKEKLGPLGSVVSEVFGMIWDVISTILNFIWSIFSTVFNAIWNIVSPILNAILNVISVVFTAIWNIISPIINKVWETIKFVLSKIQEIWSTIWNTISNIVTTVWNGIWNGIKAVINLILSGIESFVNGTIKGINKLLSGISDVANAAGSLIGLDPINLQINTISLPRLAKGGVLTQATPLIAGEYLGARTNPEIVTPQNIMYDTMRKAIEDTEFHNSNSQQHLSIYYMGKEIFDDTIDYINEKSRRIGECVINVT